MTYVVVLFGLVVGGFIATLSALWFGASAIVDTPPCGRSLLMTRGWST